jgi:hypothetical protein
MLSTITRGGMREGILAAADRLMLKGLLYK